jgi:hypothetical protein
MGHVKNKLLWDAIESDIEKKLEHKVYKKPLFSIGREFETRRKSIINSIELEDGFLKVKMFGSIDSNDNLTVFKNNKLENVVVPIYRDRIDVLISCE